MTRFAPRLVAPRLFAARLVAPCLVLLVLSACDDVGPIATLGATRLAWEAVAEGEGWAAQIDSPEITLTLDGRTATVSAAHEDTRRGRVFSGTLEGRAFTLLLAPGPCALGPEGTPPRYEFVVTMTVGGAVRSGCGSRPWVIGYSPPA